MKWNFVFAALAFIGFSSCEYFDYNVYETNHSQQYPETKTSYNINRLLNLPHKDTLHVIFTGDEQRFYDDVEDMVKQANNINELDAVIITGDLSDFSANKEFEWLNRQLLHLRVPFLTVIGNHDCLANGTKLYEDFYGPLNYSFTWNDIRFVMHNSNGREFGFNGKVPDIAWLQQQVDDTANFASTIFVSHVPPYDNDYDKSLEDDYTKLVHDAKRTIFSSNGHKHNFQLSQYYNDSIYYLNTSSPYNRVYCCVTIYPYATGTKKFDCVTVHF